MKSKLFSLFLIALLPSVLYKSLDPTSPSQLFAFYELYPETVEGKAALKKGWELLTQTKIENNQPLFIPKVDFHFIISLINNQSLSSIDINKEQIDFIENISQSLANRKLKGYKRGDTVLVK